MELVCPYGKRFGFAVLLAVLLVYRLMTGKSIDWKKYTVGLTIFLIELGMIKSFAYGSLITGYWQKIPIGISVTNN